MHKRFSVVFFVVILSMLLLFSISASGVGAQGGSWTVTVFNPDSKTFSTITPDGLTPGAALPDGSITFTNVWGVRLSPSGTYAVFNGTTSDQDPGGAYIANLAAGSCCIKLQDPAQPNLSATYIGPFSPDETQIVASMLDMVMLGSGTTLPPATIMVFDLASGSIVASTPVSSIQSEDTFAMAAAFGSWDQNGIRVIPTCWGCEGVWQGLYSIWNPLSNTMSAPTEPFDIFRQSLPATGELIKSTANNAYPLSGAPGAYFAASNVVEYYANTAQTTGQAIYFNPANPYVTNSTWVYDGRAILVQLGGKPVSTADNPFFNEDPGEAYLLFRDGRQVPVQATLGYPLTGTPDGWIAQRWGYAGNQPGQGGRRRKYPGCPARHRHTLGSRRAEFHAGRERGPVAFPDNQSAHADDLPRLR